MNRKPETYYPTHHVMSPKLAQFVSELRLEEQPALPVPAAPAPAPAPAPAEPVEPVNIILPQFDETECIDGGMENGETMGTMEIGEGIQGITCKRSPEGPAEVQALAFDPAFFADEAAAKAWAESNAFIAWSKRVASRHEMIAYRKPRLNETRFEELAPGEPEDPKAPKFSEGMTTFKIEVQKAIDDRGWSFFVSMEPEYDFIIEELWPDRALVIDTLTGVYFSLLIAMNDDGTINLGDPVRAEITVTIPKGEVETKPIGAQSRSLRRTGTMAMVQKVDNVPKGSTPLYRVLLTQGGWTKDNRYVTDDCLKEAVALGKFDAAKCWYGHPEPNTGGKRTRLAVGFVKPGSVKLETNHAGHVDVWGEIAIMRSTGTEIQEFLDQSLDIGVPLLGTSVYCRETENHFGLIEGRKAQIFTKLLSEKVNVDFVDDPAFPRAGVTDKLAADNARNSPEGTLTMDERERLALLEKENTELKAEKARAKKRGELAAVVDAELAKTGWPEEFVAIQRPIMLSIELASVRASQIATMNMILGRKKPTLAGNLSGPHDGGPGAPSVLSPEMSAQLEAIAKSRGWKPGTIQRAEETAFGA